MTKKAKKSDISLMTFNEL